VALLSCEAEYIVGATTSCKGVWLVFAHEMNKSRMLLLKIGHRRLQRGHPSPGQVASDQGEGQDPQQLKELWWRLVDLNEVKMRRKEN
jgi:hypothetical protein